MATTDTKTPDATAAPDVTPDATPDANATSTDTTQADKTADGTTPPSPTADQPDNNLPNQAEGTTANSDSVENTELKDLENAPAPGDDGYDANSDPVVPSSVLAQIISVEAESGSSPTRDALLQARKDELNANA